MKTALLAFLALAASCLAQDKITIRVTDASGAPIKNAKVAAILKSGAYQEALLDQESYVCQPTGQCIKIFAGAPGFEGSSTKYSGTGGTVTISLKPNAQKNSTVLFRRGTLPGIDGDVQPHLDASNRMYMHGIKIGFEERGRPAKQPVDFTLKRPIDAVSPTGGKFKIWVLDLTSEASVVEFSLPK